MQYLSYRSKHDVVEGQIRRRFGRPLTTARKQGEREGESQAQEEGREDLPTWIQGALG